MKVLRRIGVSALIVSFLSAGICYGQSVAMQSLSKGVDFAAQGKFKEAKEEFEKALKADPFYESAKESLRIIEDVADKKIECKTAIHLFKGAAYVIKWQTGEAIAEYNKAIELNPRFAMAYRARGKAYSKKRQHDKAISDYNKAKDIDPRFAMAYYNRGIAYEANGNMKQACSDWKTACELGDCSNWGIINKIRCLGK